MKNFTMGLRVGSWTWASGLLALVQKCCLIVCVIMCGQQQSAARCMPWISPSDSLAWNGFRLGHNMSFILTLILKRKLVNKVLSWHWGGLRGNWRLYALACSSAHLHMDRFKAQLCQRLGRGLHRPWRQAQELPSLLQSL